MPLSSLGWPHVKWTKRQWKRVLWSTFQHVFGKNRHCVLCAKDKKEHPDLSCIGLHLISRTGDCEGHNIRLKSLFHCNLFLYSFMQAFPLILFPSENLTELEPPGDRTVCPDMLLPLKRAPHQIWTPERLSVLTSVLNEFTVVHCLHIPVSNFKISLHKLAGY